MVAVVAVVLAEMAARATAAPASELALVAHQVVALLVQLPTATQQLAYDATLLCDRAQPLGAVKD